MHKGYYVLDTLVVAFAVHAFFQYRMLSYNFAEPSYNYIVRDNMKITPMNLTVNLLEKECMFHHWDGFVSHKIDLYKQSLQCFEYGYIWKFNHVEPINMTAQHFAVLIMFIDGKMSTNKFRINQSFWSDSRWKYFKLENALKYCKMNGYDLVFMNKAIFKYQSMRNDTDYNKYMNSPHFQKLFLIKHFVKSYSWMLWMDFDSFIYDCHSANIQNIINIAYETHEELKFDETISLIFAGGPHTRFNSGVFLIQNNFWSHRFLIDALYVIQNAEKYKLHSVEPAGIKDQKVMGALLQGWHINITQTKYIANKAHLFKARSYAEWPILDANMRKYAVAIPPYTINARISHYSKPSMKKSIMIFHFAGRQHNDEKKIIMVMMNDSNARCSF